MDVISSFAMNLINKNPNVRNNPRTQELIAVIQSGDSKRGAEIANNLCNTYGVNREDAVANAKSFFNIH